MKRNRIFKIKTDLYEAVPGLRLHELGLECGEAGARGEQVGRHGAVGHQHDEALSITTQHLCSVYSSIQLNL